MHPRHGDSCRHLVLDVPNENGHLPQLPAVLLAQLGAQLLKTLLAAGNRGGWVAKRRWTSGGGSSGQEGSGECSTGGVVQRGRERRVGSRSAGSPLAAVAVRSSNCCVLPAPRDGPLDACLVIASQVLRHQATSEAGGTCRQAAAAGGVGRSGQRRRQRWWRRHSVGASLAARGADRILLHVWFISLAPLRLPLSTTCGVPPRSPQTTTSNALAMSAL